MKKIALFLIILFINNNTLGSEVYFDLSEKEIQIETDFNGKEIIIFGIFEPKEDTIISIKGPNMDTKILKKEKGQKLKFLQQLVICLELDILGAIIILDLVGKK